MKSPGSVTGHRTDIVIPRACQGQAEVDYEVELAVVIGKPAKNVTAATALDYVLGYSVANDVSARRWQGKKGERRRYDCDLLHAQTQARVHSQVAASGYLPSLSIHSAPWGRILFPRQWCQTLRPFAFARC